MNIKTNQIKKASNNYPLFEATKIIPTNLSFIDRLEDYLDNYPNDAISDKQTSNVLIEMCNYLVDVTEDKTKIPFRFNSPAEQNKFCKSLIIKLFKKLKPYFEKEFTKKFAEDFASFNNLFESEQNFKELTNNQKEDKKETAEIKNILDYKRNQFNFECGLFMGNLSSDKDTHLSFSLKFHDKNTTNFEDFKEEISKFLSISNNKLTDTDILNLEAHYNKYSENSINK